MIERSREKEREKEGGKREILGRELFHNSPYLLCHLPLKMINREIKSQNISSLAVSLPGLFLKGFFFGPQMFRVVYFEIHFVLDVE